MRKVFLDVGAHLGESMDVAMNPRWGFDKIYSFEPAPQCWSVLDSMADDRVEVLRFGLWNCDTTMKLHDPGEIGASLFSSKSITSKSAQVELRDAAVWFADHLSSEDEIIMKVNCEGAECDLLDHLLAAGELAKVNELVVHFDVRKVPEMAARENSTRRRLDAAEIPYRPADDILFGRNVREKTYNWLSWYHASGWPRLTYSHLRRAEFAVRIPLFHIRQRVQGLRG